MHWQVGIDEAGYGPNLGPFVMTMVTAKVPAGRGESDLWKLLGALVRRAAEPRDNRLIVDDSKAVYSPATGLCRLEENVCPFFWDQGCAETAESSRDAHVRLPFEALWSACCQPHVDELESEPWWSSPGLLPVSDACCHRISAYRGELRLAQVDAQVSGLMFRAIAVMPRQFNAVTARHGSKAAVPMHCIRELLAHLPSLSSAVRGGSVAVDKLGGRNRYYELVQEAFEPAPVMIRGEAEDASAYDANLEQGRWQVRFEARADSRHFTVALASMFSKYLRELMMLQFNRFWQRHVPGLKPTAGYPSDAKRFWHDIGPARQRLGIAEEVLWRVR